MDLHERRTRGDFERGVTDTIGECFSIYGKRFRQMFAIALLAQLPLTALSAVMSDSLRTILPALRAMQAAADEAGAAPPLSDLVDLVAPLLAFLAVGVALTVFMLAATAYAVAAHYATDGVDVRRCWSRVWWRVLTLLVLGAAYFCLLVLTVVGVAFVVPAIALLALGVYWSVAAQAAMIEGRKPIAAVKRSFNLVQGNWLRTLLTWVLTALTAFGLTVILMVMLTITLAPALSLTGGSPDVPGAGAAASVISAVGSLAANALILPIPGIAAALIYLNLRGRKEDFGINELARDLGFQPALTPMPAPTESP